MDIYFGSTEQYFNLANSVAVQFNEFYDKLFYDPHFRMGIDATIPFPENDIISKIRFAFLGDLVKCYEQLGHDSTYLLCKEGLPMFLVESHVIIPYSTYNYISFRLGFVKERIAKLACVNEKVKSSLLKWKGAEYFYVNEALEACGQQENSIRYFSILYRLFSVIAKCDDKITLSESRWLLKLMSFKSVSKDYGLKDFEKMAFKKVDSPQQDAKTKSEGAKPNPLKELNSLIGLKEVKKDISAISDFVKIQQIRNKKGIKPAKMSYHCVFTGNPGTGKTTVARILAKIYEYFGILKKGHLVETDRSGLVAEYVGQTAVKTNKIIDSALDGVLFIDEAYSLVQGGGNDYGQEAISTLLKRMEDDRDRLIVVLAGYSDEIKKFIDSNPGLQSRFNRYIHFPDYTAEELLQIFHLNVKENQYKLEEAADALLSEKLKFAVEHKQKNFGNGRFVRNLFEKTIQNQAIRLSPKPNISDEEMMLLKAEDIPEN